MGYPQLSTDDTVFKRNKLKHSFVDFWAAMALYMHMLSYIVYKGDSIQKGVSNVK